MKRLTTVALATVLLLGSCAASITGANAKPYTTENGARLVVEQDGFTAAGFFTPEEFKARQTALAEEQARQEAKQRWRKQAQDNSIKMARVLEELEKTAGRTWYVFSGSTPRGWDCSGLVLWTYRQMGVELYHGAGVQALSGVEVDKPVPGDLVAYYYSGSSRAFHIGVYLGNGKVIHSQKPGTKTRIESATDGVINQGWVHIKYIQIIPLIDISDREKANPAVPDVAS